MEPKIQPLKRCGCANPNEKCEDLARTIKPGKLNPDTTLVFDVRREADYAASNETIPGALWKNPDKIDAWIGAVPRTLDAGPRRGERPARGEAARTGQWRDGGDP